MLLGEFEQRLDDKNRVTLPARLREHFADGVVCARGLDGCVSVWSPGGWEAFVSLCRANGSTASRAKGG